LTGDENDVDLAVEIGVGHRPIGTRCFNPSNQLRTTLRQPAALRSGGLHDLLSAPSY